MVEPVSVPKVDIEVLRSAISTEYREVALNPQKGFHFHTGRPLAKILGYDEKLIETVPENSVHSFAGTGNPFSLGTIRPGERVVDIGSGAGFDSFIASHMVGNSGYVIGIDMTPEMLGKAQRAAEGAGLTNIEFRQGVAEALPSVKNLPIPIDLRIGRPLMHIGEPFSPLEVGLSVKAT
jgi:SAM-dependent methyltransferase